MTSSQTKSSVSELAVTAHKAKPVRARVQSRAACAGGGFFSWANDFSDLRLAVSGEGSEGQINPEKKMKTLLPKALALLSTQPRETSYYVPSGLRSQIQILPSPGPWQIPFSNCTKADGTTITNDNWSNTREQASTVALHLFTPFSPTDHRRAGRPYLSRLGDAHRDGNGSVRRSRFGSGHLKLLGDRRSHSAFDKLGGGFEANQLTKETLPRDSQEPIPNSTTLPLPPEAHRRHRGGGPILPATPARMNSHECPNFHRPNSGGRSKKEINA